MSPLSTIQSVFNVRDFGASGGREDDAGPAVQQAIDACDRSGGGVVYFPPGSYTCATLHLCSHLRMVLEAGATVFASKDSTAYGKRALFYGEDLVNISLEGRGTVDGQATYTREIREWDDRYIYSNQVLMEEAGLPLLRPFPTPDSIGNLVLLIRCENVRIAGLSFIHSPSWTIHPFQCDRLVIDGVYIYTSRENGVWADGIDPDGCRDVHIANCTIDTGDDALVFYSSASYGPPRPCENITVTNCRLSSSSSAIKFCDGNLTAIRNVVIDNCVITNSNRGIAFMVFDGGLVENVIISNLTVECVRHDWYWWGDADPLHFKVIRRSQIDPKLDPTSEPPIGKIRNVLIRNLFASGMGPCLIAGHPESPLEGLALENVRLSTDEDRTAPLPLQKTVTGLTIRSAERVRLRDVELEWKSPGAQKWQTALALEDVVDLLVDGLHTGSTHNELNMPTFTLNRVSEGIIRHCRADRNTEIWCQVGDTVGGKILFSANDLHHARVAIELAPDVPAESVTIHP